MMSSSTKAEKRPGGPLGVIAVASFLLLAGCASAPPRPVEVAPMTCDAHLRAAARAEALAASRDAASRDATSSWVRGSHWTMKRAAERAHRQAEAHRLAAARLRGDDEAACLAVPGEGPSSMAGRREVTR